MQLYKEEGRLFDGDLIIDIRSHDTAPKKNAATIILNRLGYEKLEDWQDTEWGYQAHFGRKQR